MKLVKVGDRFFNLSKVTDITWLPASPEDERGACLIMYHDFVVDASISSNRVWGTAAEKLYDYLCYNSPDVLKWRRP